MFKRGGDVMDAKGTGITSGLDTPRQGYAHEAGHVTQLSELEKARAANVVSPKDRSGAFWTGISQGFGGAKTLSEAVMNVVSAQSKAIEPYEARVAEKGLALDKLAVAGELETGLKEMDIAASKWITQLEAKTDISVAQIAADNTATAKLIKELKAQYTKDDGTVDVDNPAYREKMNVIILKFNKNKSANLLMIALINSGMATNPDEAVQMALRMIMASEAVFYPTEKIETDATGGRVGYQFGTNMQGVQPQQGLNQLTQGLNQPTQVGLNVDETISTPAGTVQEDVSIREKIQPSVNMTYEEFRAKMPPEVDDDIVQLIYYNEDAFADFAQIKTQDEVYAFNNKWGVTLVLPFNTEIT